MFSCKFCEMFKNTFFKEHLLMVASSLGHYINNSKWEGKTASWTINDCATFANIFPVLGDFAVYLYRYTEVPNTSVFIRGIMHCLQWNLQTTPKESSLANDIWSKRFLTIYFDLKQPIIPKSQKTLLWPL